MRVEILDKAEDDLVEGFKFYEAQQPGLGSYFLDNLYSDIDSLTLSAGIHRVAYRQYHRMLSKRFPFAVFYKVGKEIAFVHAVLDCRRSPAWCNVPRSFRELFPLGFRVNREAVVGC